MRNAYRLEYVSPLDFIGHKWFYECQYNTHPAKRVRVLGSGTSRSTSYTYTSC